MSKRYEIDGREIHDLPGFYDQVSTVIIRGVEWGRNLNAFNDILRGGFGTPDEGFTIVWRNAGLSRQRLGYDETVRVLRLRLETCHPSNRDDVARDIASALERQGSTVFDWLVGIIRDHGPGGTEADDNVLLELR